MSESKSTVSACLIVQLGYFTCVYFAKHKFHAYKPHLVNGSKLVQIERKFSEICTAPVAPQVRHDRRRENREGHVQRAMPGNLPVPEQVIPSEAEYVSSVRCCGTFRSGTAH